MERLLAGRSYIALARSCGEGGRCQDGQRANKSQRGRKRWRQSAAETSSGASDMLTPTEQGASAVGLAEATPAPGAGA